MTVAEPRAVPGPGSSVAIGIGQWAGRRGSRHGWCLHVQRRRGASLTGRAPRRKRFRVDRATDFKNCPDCWASLPLCSSWRPTAFGAADVGVAPPPVRQSSDTHVENPSPLNAAAVRALPQVRAREGLPAELDGTITYIDQYNLFVTDSSGSIYVRPEWPSPAPTLKIGDRVRLERSLGTG